MIFELRPEGGTGMMTVGGGGREQNILGNEESQSEVSREEGQ